MSEDVQKDQGSERLQLQKVQVLEGPEVCWTNAGGQKNKYSQLRYKQITWVVHIAGKVYQE